MKTFNVNINYKHYTNVQFLNMLYLIQEELAKNNIDDIPTIVDSETGEVVNDYEFYLDDNKYTISELLDMLPYFNRFNKLKCYNNVIWEK